MSVDNVNSKRSLLENINKITNTDTLTEFVEKCNNNFTAIVKNGGGPKGDRGVKGDQGNPTKPKVPIHVWKKGVDYESETQTETQTPTGTQTIFNIKIDQDKLSDVKYQENHLILLENAHVYKLVLDKEKYTLKPEFVFELLYFNPDDIKKRNLHIACADSYDASNNKYVGFKVMTNTLYPIQKPYVGICIDDNEDSPDEQLSYNWIYIGGSGSGPSNPGSGPSNPGSGPSNPGSGPSNPGSGKCIYVTLSNDNGNFIYSDINSDLPISGPVSTIARLEIDGEPVNKGVTWSCTPTDNVVLPQENYKGEDYTESGYIGRKFEVTGMSGNEMSGSLKITATYGDNIYPKVFSLRKYINESTYDINPTITTLTLLDTSSKPIDIYFQIKETTTNNKHIYYPRNDQDRIFGDSKVLNLFIELIRDTELVQLEDELIPDIVKSSNNDSVYYYKLTIDDIDDISTLKSYNTLRININKNNSDFNEFEDIAIVSLESSLDLDISAGYLSTVFTRSATKPAIPKGGNWDNPVPTDPKGEVTWYDGIIPGIEQLYESHATISSDGTKPVWSEPDPMTDSFNAKYIFSTEESPVGPRPNNPDKDKGPKFNEKYWTDDVTDSENTLWKAESYFTNGVWGPWQVCKIKGEKGNDGTSISIKGSGRAVDNLSDANENDKVLLLKTHKENGATIPWIYLWNKDANDGSGDWVKYDGNEGEAYVIDGYLYVWDGDTWVNCGRFKGDAGVSQFVHIKYANEDPNGTKIKYQGKYIFISFTDSNTNGDTTDDNDGETPGSYVGIRVDENVNDSNNIKDYEWHKWNGEDGWGYDYIYCLTKEYEAPTIPKTTGPYDPTNSSFNVNNTWVWKDDPQDVTKNMPYCWVCYSQFIDGAWTTYRGKSKTSTKGVLWSKWSKDGGDGKDIRLDLDNQNDFLIYNSGKIVPEGATVSTIAKLYENGKLVEAKFTKNDTGCYSEFENYNVGNKSTQAKVVVTGLSDGVASGYVTINATYDDNVYSAQFNVKRLISQNKYQLIVSPTAISYDDDKSVTKKVTIQVRKTDGSTGESTIMESLDTDFTLWRKYDNDKSEQQISKYENNRAELTWNNNLANSNIQILLKEKKGASNYFTWDSEDIPIFKGGKTGKSGKIPYYAGVYDKNTEYKQTDTSTPYVFYNAGGDNDNSGYYLLISDIAPKNSINSTDISKYWLKMTEFEAIYSNVGVIKQALVGKAVFNKDWIFSQDGCKYEKKIKAHSSAKNDYYMEEGFNLYNDDRIKAGINFTDKDWIQTNRQLLVYNDDNFKTYNSLIGEPYTYSDILKYKPVNFPIGSENLTAVCTGYYVPYDPTNELYNAIDLYINIKYDNLANVSNKPENGSEFLFAHIGSSANNNLLKILKKVNINNNTIYTWNTYPVYAFYYDDVTNRRGCVKARKFFTDTYTSTSSIPTNNTNYDIIKINDSDKYYVYGIKDVNNKVKLKWHSYLLKINKTSYNNYSEFDPSVKDIRLSNDFSPNWAVNLKTGSMWTGGGSNCMLADGSGSLAGGKISWDTMGNLYLPPTGTLSMSSNSVGNKLTFKMSVTNSTSLNPQKPIVLSLKFEGSDNNGESISTELINYSKVVGIYERFPYHWTQEIYVDDISKAIGTVSYSQINATFYIDNIPVQSVDITDFVSLSYECIISVAPRNYRDYIDIQILGYTLESLDNEDDIYDNPPYLGKWDSENSEKIRGYDKVIRSLASIDGAMLGGSPLSFNIYYNDINNTTYYKLNNDGWSTSKETTSDINFSDLWIVFAVKNTSYSTIKINVLSSDDMLEPNAIVQIKKLTSPADDNKYNMDWIGTQYLTTRSGNHYCKLDSGYIAHFAMNPHDTEGVHVKITISE